MNFDSKDIKDYTDDRGLIVTLGGDGGDSCSHGFAILYAKQILEGGQGIPGMLYQNKLRKVSGLYCRNPDPLKWYSRTNTFSRDQMIPLLVFMGFKQWRVSLRLFFGLHKKNYFLFAWNTKRNHVYELEVDHIKYSTPDVKWDYSNKMPDLTGPEIWATWIRGFRCYALYPLLCILDIENLISSIIHRYFRHTDIQMNHIVLTDFATRVMPTPTSLLSRWIYGKREARWALNNKWGNLIDEPPVNQFLVPLIETWKVRE